METAICDPISHHAFTQPETLAIIDGEITVTYRSLDRLVRKTAAHLLDIGVGPGDSVGLCLKDNSRHLIAMLAVARMGGVIVPIDWRAKAEEKANLAAAFDVEVMLTEAESPSSKSVPTLVLDSAWQSAVSKADGDRAFSRNLNAPLVIGLSSGTTGTPKGIPLTHGNQFARALINLVCMDLGRGHSFLCALPLCFTGARNQTFSHFLAGNTIILYPPLFTPEEFVTVVNRYEASCVRVVPTILRQLMQLPERATPMLPTVRALITGGEPMAPEEKEEVVRRVTPNVYETYAVTGASMISILGPNEIAKKTASVGRPTFLTEVEIVDDEDSPLPKGTVGRLRCRGPGVAGDFYGGSLAAREDEQFRDGWFYPGELAEMDDDGYLYLKGRASDLIIRGGVNIYPDEIERILLLHLSVAEAAVVGSPSREFGEEVTAFVVPRGDIAVREVMAHCRARLTAHKVPRRIIPVEALPKTAAGKVRKRELAARLMDQ
jgi:acyl-CoA synthetase (AMP-forming)/AMP-acid ligase II